MFPVAGIAGLGLGLVQSFFSSQQQKQQDKLFQQALAGRPAYQIPQATKDALAQSQAQLNETNPAILAAQNQARQQAANQMGFAQNNASSGVGALAAAANAQQQYNSSLPALAQAQTQYRQQNEENYQRAQAQMARAQEAQVADQQEANNMLLNYRLGRAGAANSGLSQGLGLAAQGLSILGNPLNQTGRTTNTQFPTTDYLASIAPNAPVAAPMSPAPAGQLAPIPGIPALPLNAYQRQMQGAGAPWWAYGGNYTP